MPRSESLNNYQVRINRVLDHITANPAAAHTVASLAKVARFSQYHFHRVFRSLVGEPVHTLVRRVRLERAVFRLAHGPRTSLTQIALDAGFASSSDFSRAFREAYGFPPSKYSRKRLLEESKIRQDLLANRGYVGQTDENTGNEDRFRVRVVERTSQPIVYLRVIGHDTERITSAYERLMLWGRNQVPGARLIGRSADDPDITPVDRCRFDWCLTVPDGVRASGGLSNGVIPAGQFAVLRCRGDLQKEYRAWTHLFRVWLPQSGFEPAPSAAFEWYHRDPMATGWSDLDLDCYLPIRRLERLRQ